MTYVPKEWKNEGEPGAIPISAENLNDLEQGVADASEAAETAQTTADDAAALAQSTADALEDIEISILDPEYTGTEIGVSSIEEDGSVRVTVASRWGIDDDGNSYYNSDGVTPGEEAVLMVNEDGELILCRLANLTVIP